MRPDQFFDVFDSPGSCFCCYWPEFVDFLVDGGVEKHSQHNGRGALIGVADAGVGAHINEPFEQHFMSTREQTDTLKQKAPMP
jgi:hypothetical protein